VELDAERVGAVVPRDLIRLPPLDAACFGVDLSAKSISELQVITSRYHIGVSPDAKQQDLVRAINTAINEDIISNATANAVPTFSSSANSRFDAAAASNKWSQVKIPVDIPELEHEPGLGSAGYVPFESKRKVVPAPSSSSASSSSSSSASQPAASHVSDAGSQTLKWYEVKREPHPTSGSRAFFCLHDRLHGKAHTQCRHRSPDLVRQFDALNTSISEQVNEGRYSYTIFCFVPFVLWCRCRCMLIYMHDCGPLSGQCVPRWIGLQK